MPTFNKKNDENSEDPENANEIEEDYFDLAWNNRESRRRCEVTHRKHKMADFEKFKTKKKN